MKLNDRILKRLIREQMDLPYHEDENDGGDSQVSPFTNDEYDQNKDPWSKDNNWKEGPKMKIADGVKMTITDRQGNPKTIRSGLYKLYAAPKKGYVKVGAWQPDYLWLGDVEVAKIKALYKAGKLTGTLPHGDYRADEDPDSDYMDHSDPRSPNYDGGYDKNKK